jgi:hypothetical protein
MLVLSEAEGTGWTDFRGSLRHVSQITTNTQPGNFDSGGLGWVLKFSICSTLLGESQAAVLRDNPPHLKPLVHRKTENSI